MASQDVQMSVSAAPAPNPVVGNTAVLTNQRDLAAERDAEASRERADAAKKANRFQARKMTPYERPAPQGPEFENYMFEAAANNPFATLKNPAPSTFVPNLAVIFYQLAFMDHLMAGTKRWVDNCLGWAPPISQAYIALVLYVQVIRAMDAASLLGPGSELATFLITFESIFPLADIWIPGPLVAALRNLSAFWPTSSDRFGNVSPVLPSSPGWTQANFYRLHYSDNAQNDTHVGALLPHIPAFFSRMRYVCATAAAAANQAAFTTAFDGPNHMEHLFGVALNNAANEQRIIEGPGLPYAYPDLIQLWTNANARLAANSIPVDLNAAATPVTNSWVEFFRFDNNQHVWFGSASAIMAKYCQFFNGSVPLSQIMPNCSAAAAMKGRSTAGTTLWTMPVWTAPVVGPPAVAGHYTLRSNARFVLNGRLAVEDVPTTHVYAGTTFGYNTYWAANVQTIYRFGPFWTLGPDTDGRDNIEVLPGTLSTITRRYHSDTRIPADKQ